MITILITQCLERDFVDPIGAHDPLPSSLHVGYREVIRLLGLEPAVGALAQLIDWTRSRNGMKSKSFTSVNGTTPTTSPSLEHLQQFGAHRIKGSSGARLVLGMDERSAENSNERIVDSLTLDDSRARISRISPKEFVTRTAMSSCASASSASRPSPR